MLTILITVILTSAFFILFFNPELKVKNKTEETEEASTIKGFVEDTYRGPVTDRFIPPRLVRLVRLLGTQVYRSMTGCMVFPMKKPSRNTANAIIQVDFSTFANISLLVACG